MPSPITEFLNGGVVTSRHPALLSPGELQRGDDCVYRDKDPAIWRAPSRAALNSVALSGGVKGLLHLTWEGTRNDQILAYSGTSLWRSDLTSLSLTFTEITTSGAVDGTVSSTTTFTATSGNPFTADVIGCQPFFIASAGTPSTARPTVTAVTGTPDASGHYPGVVLDTAQTNGAYTLAFDFGLVMSLQDNKTDANHMAPDETLDAAFYGNSYFLWTGRGTPYRVDWRKRKSIGGTAYDDILLARPVGLLPVREAFSLTNLTGVDAGDDAYAWPATLGTGVFWFMLTEIFTFAAADGSEQETEGAYLGKNSDSQSASAGEPVPISVASLSSGVQLQTPPSGAVNNGSDGRIATHWGVYMYGPTQDTSQKPSLASFRRIAKVPISATTAGYGVSQAIPLSDSKKTQRWAYPTVDNGGADGRPSMSNSSRMLGNPDGNYATSKSGSSTDGSEQHTGVNRLSSFKCTGAGGSGAAWQTTAPWASRPVQGLQVAVRGAANPDGNAGRSAGYYIYLRNGTGTKSTPVVYGTFGSKDLHTNYHGGETDTWGVAWTTSDFDANWSVVIGKTGTGSRQRLRIESIGVYVFWTSGSINLNGKPYRVVTYRDQIGTTVNDPANVPMKECSTGDFFQGSLVTNDLGDETALRFSLPTNPEVQPKPYVLRFNTKKKDKITLVKTLGSVLLVGMNESIKRVNYLPRETDTDLSSGLAHEDIATDHGIPGPQAAVRFDMPGAGTMMAYASIAGPFLTNGVTTTPLNVDLDWPNLVKTSALSSCVFKVYPKEKWLALYYCPAGATHNLNTRVIYFCYQADKIKDGMLPSIGPCVVSGKSACEVSFNGTPYLFTGHESNGFVYQEDVGTVIPTGYRVRLTDDSNTGDGRSTANTDVSILPFIRTRKMFPAGIERDAREERIYLLFSSYGSSLTATGTSTKDSLTLTSSAAFGSVVPGMRVSGSGLDPNTIVLSKTDSSSITISRAANATATGTLTFDTGTVGITVRGSGIGEAVVGCDTHYNSMITGDLLSVHNDNMRQGIELQIEKVPLTFDSNHDTLTSADLGVNMRLHQFTIMFDDESPEMNRAS